jgi:ABC-type multidrug transport system fused ATPase/permease subunit
MAELRDFIALTLNFPLQLFAAFISGIISTLLLTVQPVLIKTFINESTRGVDGRHLVTLLIFMGLSLLLAFVFDTIKVSMETVLKLKIENELRSSFHEHFSSCSKEKYDFAVRRGLFSLGNFSFLLSFTLPMALVNIIVILVFISLESFSMGILTSLLCIGSFILNYYVSKRLGGISSFKEEIKTQMIQDQSADLFKYRGLINQLQKKEGSRFLWSTLLFLNQYSLFKFVPLLVLMVFISSSSLNPGSIAGLFLFFGLLIRPYQLLSLALQDLLVLYHQNEFIREEARLCMPLKKLKKSIPYGRVRVFGTGISIDRKSVEIGGTSFIFNSNDPRDFDYDLDQKLISLSKLPV